ncbi:TlpA family protein disulfide reductase [Polaribacter sp.]|uniref:TlpA family protein disulfide reductase n=1 Tax=uncultured Polaribacter sp. TaxID=174711 RepID=UPI002338E47B|nr:TlpA family protein disulfide reductase [Polaribacter sp.]
MKKIILLILFISSFAQAQFSINGTLTHGLDTDWVVLYRIEGSKQKFVQNTTMTKDTLFIEGKMQTIGTFNFELPATAQASSYRISYRTRETSFVDFIFNKENVSFTFHPDYPEQSILFSESKENTTYKNYLKDIFAQQQKLDSLQVTAIRNPKLDLKKSYKAALLKINSAQQAYLESTQKLYIYPFVKASFRVNPPELKTNVKEYMSAILDTFFEPIDFSNQALVNSSFLLDRVTDYIFYLNYSEDATTQQILYKSAVETVFTKIENAIFKKNVIEFLIEKFEENNNLRMIDFLFENYYDALPTSLQNAKFKSEKVKLLATAIGRIAPDFSWKEHGKDFQLSNLNDAKNYVLVFWSTECSHCLKEIPELHAFLQDKKNLKVIAFAMETTDLAWSSMKASLPNWHHVLGLNKWRNTVARSYNINATPNYFILDADKRIIAKPIPLEELKYLMEKL